jgi:hypothetical protein
MTENDRLRHRVGLIAHGDVGVAYSGGHDAYQDFVRPRFFKAQFFKGSGLFWRSGNSGSYFHFQGSSFWLARRLKPRADQNG